MSKSGPSRVVTIHGIECEVPDHPRFAFYGYWRFEQCKGACDPMEISADISCAFAAAYWRADAVALEMLHSQDGDRRAAESDMRAERWQRAFEAAREGGK